MRSNIFAASRRTILGHVGTTEEVQAFGGIRLRRDRTLQTPGHLFHRLRRLGEFPGQLDLVAGTEMQVQAQAQHRHQHGRQQRHRLAQARHPWRGDAFGVGEQFTGGFGAAGVHLRGIEHALFLLSLQLSHALLIQRHVQGGTILFKLGATTTQNGDQQKTQGHQKQQTCSEPEINHSWFLSNSWSRRSRSSAESEPGVSARCTRRRRTITAMITKPPSSRPAGPNQSSAVLAFRAGL